MKQRKNDHIRLALDSQTKPEQRDNRFNYEPMLSSHPDSLKPIIFLGKKIKTPIWVSSMTGGTILAKEINLNLAKACKEFGMGMGLGSCRIILNDNKQIESFNFRKIIGDDLPFYANLGISQVEELVTYKKVNIIKELVDKLNADGLVVHVNPLQEWFQVEGDRFQNKPIDIIRELLEKADLKIIVKEVGQGMGPQSLKELLKLPLAAIEFGAFGGTNFSLVELFRRNEYDLEAFESFTKVGHTAKQMVGMINQLVNEETSFLCKEVIISGGIKSFLDGYYLMQKCKIPSIYGQGSVLLKYAKEDYESLRNFIDSQVKGLQIAQTYLTINNVELNEVIS